MKVTKDYAATLAAINTALTFQHQADAVLSQADPVSGTLYTVLDTTINARILGIVTQITWAVTQPTPLAIVIAIDGQTLTHVQDNPTSGAYYNVRLRMQDAENAGVFNTDNSLGDIFRNIEGRSVKVQVRVTWAVTQPTPLVCRVKYAKR